MELPPLPDIFGNYAIRGISEILPANPVSWFPATFGWKLLLLMLLGWLSHTLWRQWQQWRRNRYRRAALAELEHIFSQQQDAQRQLAAIATVLKSTALQAYPRIDVAALSGTEWITWLNAHGPQPLFSGPATSLLTRTIYSGETSVDSGDIEQLGDMTARWIRQHEAPAHA
jgi:Ca-activated chloride channel family protein